MEIEIKNKNLLAELDILLDEFYSRYGEEEKEILLESKSVTRGAIETSHRHNEWWCSEQRLRELLGNAHLHIGPPSDYRAVPVAMLQEHNPDKWKGFYEKWRFDFCQQILGAASCALFNFYPPKGITGWHTNWDANAYQILLTWSKTGDGFFTYKEGDKVIVVPDKPGWACRWYYFGRKDEPDHHCWHAAYAGCDRITLAFKITNEKYGSERDLVARKLRDELLEEIQCE